VPSPYARPPECGPSPLARHRSLDQQPPTRDDPDSNSIAGRRAAASFKSRYRKCLGLNSALRSQRLAPRHFRSTLATSTLPINASDYTLLLQVAPVMSH
jgi:hypothetical protein